MCTDESPLYLAVNYKYLNDSIVHKQKIGKDRIITIIKRMYSLHQTNFPLQYVINWFQKQDLHTVPCSSCKY